MFLTHKNICSLHTLNEYTYMNINILIDVNKNYSYHYFQFAKRTSIMRCSLASFCANFISDKMAWRFLIRMMFTSGVRDLVWAVKNGCPEPREFLPVFYLHREANDVFECNWKFSFSRILLFFSFFLCHYVHIFSITQYNTIYNS